MASQTNNESITYEVYERAKAGCIELGSLEATELYTLRSRNPEFIRQTGKVGDFATDVTVRVIACLVEHQEVAYEAFSRQTGQAEPIRIQAADFQGLIYNRPTDVDTGEDEGYFLPADDSFNVEEDRLVSCALIELRRRESEELQYLEIPLPIELPIWEEVPLPE